MTEEIIDRTVLDEIRAIDSALLDEVVAIFAGEAPQQIAAVRAALASGDAGAIERAAHRLKGVALGVGARALAATAAAIERSGRAGDVDSGVRAAPALDADFEAAREALARVSR
jgi:HPt (histidine-containing phosphotransfer) domain-containing protein